MRRRNERSDPLPRARIQHGDGTQIKLIDRLTGRPGPHNRRLLRLSAAEFGDDVGVEHELPRPHQSIGFKSLPTSVGGSNSKSPPGIASIAPNSAGSGLSSLSAKVLRERVEKDRTPASSCVGTPPAWLAFRPSPTRSSSNLCAPEPRSERGEEMRDLTPIPAVLTQTLHSTRRDALNNALNMSWAL